MSNVERGSCRFNVKKARDGKRLIEMKLFFITLFLACPR